MSKYLITGIAGFIGSALAQTLVSRGHTVRGIDNLSTGKLENLAAIAGRIDFRKADILDEPVLLDACSEIDFVFHQAALPSVVSSIKDPLTTHRVNADGTLNLLIAARDSGVKRIVYASSCAAYGDAGLPNHEEMRPRPLSPYAVSKLAGEYYMDSFHHLYGLETVSLRYFNVFGPQQDAASEYSGAIARFIRLMLQGLTPTIFGDGEQSRDFTFVENIVAANLLACTADSDLVAGKVFNIGSGSPTTVNQVYRTLQRLLGVSEAALHAGERTGEIRHSYADISLARQKLGYLPAVAFEDAMKKTVDWFKTNREDSHSLAP